MNRQQFPVTLFKTAGCPNKANAWYSYGRIPSAPVALRGRAFRRSAIAPFPSGTLRAPTIPCALQAVRYKNRRKVKPGFRPDKNTRGPVIREKSGAFRSVPPDFFPSRVACNKASSINTINCCLKEVNRKV
jgi:hypothetical protein